MTFVTFRKYASKHSSMAVLVLFAACGTIFVVHSHASTAVVNVEAEAGQVTTQAEKVTDSTASSHSAVMFTKSSLNTVAKVLYDMHTPHEGVPHGVPVSYSWQSGPEVDDAVPPNGFAAMTAWGQVFADATTTEPSNVRVEIKNMEAYTWSLSQHKWQRVQAYTTVTGDHYNEDYSGNATVGISLRTEADGGTSANLINNYAFHFYPTDRASLSTPSDVGAAFVTYQARLILDNSSGPNNLSQARYLASAGADWWRTNSIGYGDGTNNLALGQGRMTYLSANWQAHSFYTGGPVATGVSGAWTEAQLQASPPPLDGMGTP